ncbi:unnamed protein product [Cochlearia groenlandica]
MDQNGDNSSFSFQWLLCGDDWYRWDTYPTFDVNPLLMTLTREETVQMWLQSLTNEQFETPPQGEEVVEMSTNEDSFTYEELLDLADQIGNVCTGLTVEAIDENLRPRKYEKFCGKNEKCVICLHKLKHNEEASKLGCGHDFHFQCIKKWLMVKNMCPLCKQIVI